ncbi:MAG TPA: thioredoxin [Lachnospiraceae bacterium]|nr:thioredoxin [Lachnospiraceae bacterium]
MAVLHFTNQTFEQEVLQSDIPVLVDFWAEWCGPCQAFGPVLEAVAPKYEGKVKIGKVNVDEERELARKYRIFSIPTVVIIQNGEVKVQNTGLMSEAQTEAMIAKVL